MIINIGTMIGNRYEVVEKVGTGGMADVYRAMDHRLNRYVAVKILKNEYSEDTKFVTKFRQEAQAVACLSHPNVVAVYDVGEEQGMHFIVMEFVEGITLKSYIEKKGKLSVREAVGIGIQIASGLEAAHNSHIIHRDIKPQNILISRDGTAKVTDFGIAKAASSNTITASAMGSVHYISPEQARGGFSDEKSDVYSLGVTMYEMLSGTLPFTGESAVAVALAHIQEEAVPLTAMDATIPKGISDIVAKCMQKKADFRYPTSADLIADLKMFLQDPEGEYGVVKPLYENTDTIFIKPTDVNRIKAASQTTTGDSGMTAAEPEDKKAGEEDSGEVDPKLEKALIGGSIVVAIIIGIVIIYVIGKVFGFWGGASGSTEATPTPEVTSSAASATATPEASDSAQKVTVENVAGMTTEEAKTALSQKGLSNVKVSEQQSDTVSAGKVISTDPEAGTEVEKDAEITLIVSSGTSTVQVPSVASMTVSKAKSTLAAEGFNAVEGSKVYSDTVKAGLVAYSNPKGGAQASKGATITLYISKGPKRTTTTVPDLMGMTKAQAKEALTAKKLVLGSVSTAYSDNVSKNRVCVQSKAEGTEVKTGSTVDITLSLGASKTYSYYSNKVTIDNPFDYESDPSSVFKFVLSQDGKTTTIREVSLSYSDFPYTISDVKGSSASSGEIIVYKDGKRLSSYSVDFRKVADE
ncbi:serine/threonine protein kinase with PASTA sensor(S) [Clostridium sp. CAG:167]|nr:serine/threonine protein kinase with PASTA sensor(S) [Clostridium sp. CAG:167]